MDSTDHRTDVLFSMDAGVRPLDGREKEEKKSHKHRRLKPPWFFIAYLRVLVHARTPYTKTRRREEKEGQAQGEVWARASIKKNNGCVVRTPREDKKKWRSVLLGRVRAYKRGLDNNNTKILWVILNSNLLSPLCLLPQTNPLIIFTVIFSSSSSQDPHWQTTLCLWEPRLRKDFYPSHNPHSSSKGPRAWPEDIYQVRAWMRRSLLNAQCKWLDFQTHK